MDCKILFWTSFGLTLGIYTNLYICEIPKYKQNSNLFKFGVITSMTFMGFLRGYYDNDLVTNLSLFYNFLKK